MFCPFCRPSRRAVLAGVAAASAASPALAAGARPVVIDVHHHLIPPAFLEANRERYGQIPYYRDWTPARAVEAMDANGIDIGVTSLNVPGIVHDDTAKGRALARSCNEFAAKIAVDYPGRFGSFAAVPALDAKGAVAEAAYALDVLKADGVGLMTSYRGHYLHEPVFAPLMAELNRRKAVVFVHPTIPAGGPSDLSPVTLEMPFDSARTILAGLVGGLFETYPDIRFIFAHGGGALPILAARIDFMISSTPEWKKRLPDGLLPALRGLRFDTVNVLNPPAYAMLRNLYTVDQLLFGTDNPAVPAEVNGAVLKAFPPGPDRMAIAGGNALGLMPSLQRLVDLRLKS